MNVKPRRRKKRKGGGFSWSSYWATRTPSALILTVISDTSIKLDWTANGVEDYDGYSVESSTDGVNYTEVDTVAVGTETYTNTGLTHETKYYYRVRAYKGAEYSSYCTAVYDYTFTTWYLAGETPVANAKGAYRPEDAASLAASYINLVSPGVNDAVPGTAPTWDAVSGWKFNGIDQYLTTGIVPVNNQGWSMIVKFTEHTATLESICGLYEAAGAGFVIQLDGTKFQVQNGGTMPILIYYNNGVLGFAGVKHYYNGLPAPATDIPAGSGNFTYDIWIGTVHYTSLIQMFDGNIQALGIYDKVLTPYEAYSIARSMVNQDTQLKLRHDYVEHGFGALICWNMPTFTEDEVANADLAIDTFAPTGLDIDQWLDACVAAGMTYAILTVKHHDGFALWPTLYAAPAHDPYSVAETTWYANNGSPDVVDLFVDGCRSRGLGVGLYYSIGDATYETRTGTDETTDAAAYIAMIEMQLSELLTNYGAIDSIWFDGWKWLIGHEEIPYKTIYDYVKSIQPNCIVCENSHDHPTISSQIELYEHNTDGHIAEGNVRLSEEVTTIRNDTHWFYHPLHDQTAASLQAAASLNSDRLQCNSRNGTYLLGLTPGTDGHLPAAQVTRLADIGAL